MAINLTLYSWNPNHPSFLLKCGGVSILVDCQVDMSSLSSFVYHNFSSKSFPPADTGIEHIRRVRPDLYLVESLPEFHPTPPHVLQMEHIDCILISNWNSLLALPFYVHNTGFRGRIYTTAAVVRFGRLNMTEIIEYITRIALEDIDPLWKDSEIFRRFPNPPFRNPAEWKQFYTKDVMEKVLDSIIQLSFKQSFTTFENITITPYCSGHQIGSAMWTVSTEQFKIGFIPGCSDRGTHVQLAQWQHLKGNLDALVLSSISTLSDGETAVYAAKIKEVAMETLKIGGNVLFPVAPTGFIYDLIEIIVRSIDSTAGVALDTPIYFISPVAKEAIAHASVSMEWLCEDRQNYIYGGSIPEEPFPHTQYIRGNRLKLYDSLFESFSTEVRTPCVMFCGHPSLRFGDAAHMLTLWGNDSKNAVIMTSPDFPSHEVYKPFEELKIRKYYYPIDTRATFNEINTKILTDLKPKTLYIPDCYTVPVIPGRQDTIPIVYNPCIPVTYDFEVNIANKRTRKRKIKIHPDIIKSLNAQAHPLNGSCLTCPLTGYLSAFDDIYELLPAKAPTGALAPRFCGYLTPERLTNLLREKKYDATYGDNVDGSAWVKIPALKARILIGTNGTSTKIQCPQQCRKLLTDYVKAALTPVF